MSSSMEQEGASPYCQQQQQQRQYSQQLYNSPEQLHQQHIQGMMDGDIDINVFDRAVETALNPPPVNTGSDSQHQHLMQQKQAAEEYLRQFSNRPNAWQSALKVLTETKNPNSKFVSLQAIESFVRSPGYLTQNETTRTEFRTQLFRFVQRVLEVGTLKGEPAHVVNKLSLILAWTIKRDYPERWPTAVRDVLLLGSNLANTGAVDFCLRTLQALDTEVTIANHGTSPPDTESEHNVVVKDSMRESNDLREMTNFWYNAIQTHKYNDKDLVSLCLDSMSSYIDWIDIYLVVNNQFFPLFLECLEDQSLRMESLECIYSICDKGMPELTKLDIYNKINIVNILSNQRVNTDDEENAEFAAEVATTVALVTQNGIRAANCSDVISNAQARPIALDLVQRLIELSLKYLEWDHGGFKVWQEVLPVVDEVLWHIKQLRSKERGELCKSNLDGFGLYQYLERMCLILIRRYKYPSDFDFNDQSDETAEFEQFRQSLKKVFTNGLRSTPEHFIRVITPLLTERLPSIVRLPFEEAELLLSLVYHLGECGSSVNSELEPGKPLYDSVETLHKSHPWNHHHRVVLLSYYEVAVRYAQVFCSIPERLEPLLSAMLGQKGLWHEHPSVRSRTSYLLLKLVKTLCKHCGRQAIGPLAQPILNGLQPHLTIAFENQNKEGKQLSSQDQQFIFELTGVIVGQNWISTDDKAQYLSMILSPVLEQVTQGMQIAEARGLLRDQSHQSTNSSCNALSGDDSLSRLIDWLYLCLNAIAHVTKGFGRLLQHEQLASIFERCMNVAVQALSGVPHSTLIRSKVVFLMHRMVTCLDRRLLDSLPQALPVLLKARQCSELCDLVQLIDQMLVRFRNDMIPIVTRMVGPLIQRICELLPPESAPQSELASERREIHKHFFLVVQHMLHNGCADALSTDDNVGLLWQILDSTEHGLLNITEMSVIKCCLQIFTAAVDVWLPNKSTLEPIPQASSCGKKKLLETQGNGTSTRADSKTASKGSRGRTPASEFPARLLPANAQPKFERFVFESIVPASINFAMRGHFSLRDAGCHAAVKEAVLLHAICAERSPPISGTDGRGIEGSVFLSHLRDQVLPSLRCDPENSVKYCEGLRCSLGDPYKQGKQPLWNLIKHLRTQEGLSD
eukprot:gb/GECG01011739.1/.p1 GENE.gb/GECG01011739.1/~~gb/GECG01011739.1/.p1  ORF type:complete len:1138 (+),score=96.32 gb/GECG01011739.1/:1-3414(+)